MNTKDGKRIPTEATATCPLSDPVSCDLKLKGNPFVMEKGYSVLATDYISYTITYGCSEFFWGLYNSPMLWI